MEVGYSEVGLKRGSRPFDKTHPQVRPPFG